MYVPPLFKEDRIDVLHDAMRRTGLATLVTLSQDGLIASHVPMLLDADPAPYGTLVGHLARPNPQARGAIGARGLYVPDASLHHHVPATRLTRSYFRRWWFWKGLSKCRVERRHPVTELGLDLSHVPKLAGVPRFMFRSAIRDFTGWVKAVLSRDSATRMRHEMMLCYFVGYLRGARNV